MDAGGKGEPMDWLTFISSMVDHLAWPVVVVGLLWFLFRNLDYIAQKLESIKFKDVEFNFRKDVQELKDKAESLNVTVFYPAERLQPLAARSRNDRDTVIETGDAIRSLLFEWADAQPGFSETSPTAILEKMRQEHIINDDLFHLARRVLNIRNKAVHAPTVALSAEDLAEFMGVSKSVQDRISAAVKRSGRRS
jgi:hypothetical protein